MPAVAAEPAAADHMVAEGAGEPEEAGAARWEAAGPGRARLALPSLKVPREMLRSFPHTKRVGSYLVGRMINKGSFAKVMEGLHIGTGEKVSPQGREKFKKKEKKREKSTAIVRFTAPPASVT